MGQIKKYGGV
jgi:hypothetical protein